MRFKKACTALSLGLQQQQQQQQICQWLPCKESCSQCGQVLECIGELFADLSMASSQLSSSVLQRAGAGQSLHEHHCHCHAQETHTSTV
jgi:hypothetical protein